MTNQILIIEGREEENSWEEIERKSGKMFIQFKASSV